MENLEEKTYLPFEEIESSTLFYDAAGRPQYLLYESLRNGASHFLRIKPNGFLPKSGLLVCDSLDRKMIAGKRVLEIGTGETGIIGIHAAALGATSVTACDIDREAVAWASQNSRLNRLENISWAQSDVYKGLPKEEKFDVIISNPPQMPMAFGPAHDSGGQDGRKIIRRIIEGAKDFLNTGGMLVLLVFDFLGIERRYGKQETLFHYLEENGFSPSLLKRYKRPVRKGGQTERSLTDIQLAYPSFEFRKDGGKLYHEMFTITATY